MVKQQSRCSFKSLSVVAAMLFAAMWLLTANGVSAAEPASSTATTPVNTNTQVKLKTDLGDILIELFPAEAPKTVENFLSYVTSGFYDGTQFHRVIPNFVVQGGGYTFDFVEKETRKPIVNEANNKLLNTRGTLSMARTSDPNSATAQFFINLQHNTNLDYSERNPGYAVFGQVIEGMDVVDAILDVPRGRYRGFPDAPNEMVRILKATVVKPDSSLSNAATSSAETKPIQP